ncbi:MAG: hypothetical protein AAF629_05705 [Chloroflexota bacterium]
MTIRSIIGSVPRMYHLMDIVPKGRDEAVLPYSMAWLRRHDQYEEVE